MYIIFERKNNEYSIYLSSKTMQGYTELCDENDNIFIVQSSYLNIRSLLKEELVLLAFSTSFATSPLDSESVYEVDIFGYHNLFDFTADHISLVVSEEKQKILDTERYLIDLKKLENQMILNRITKIKTNSYTA